MHPASSLTWRRSSKGNPYLRLQGIAVVIFKGWPGRRYSRVTGAYSEHGDGSEREAKLAAFEASQEAVAAGKPTRARGVPPEGP